MRTPFTLTGIGDRPDGDQLTYLWEQNDIGGDRAARRWSPTSKINGPLFRVFGTLRQRDRPGHAAVPVAGAEPRRRQPDRAPSRTCAQVLAGNTNAATGRCPQVPPLPTTRTTTCRRSAVAQLLLGVPADQGLRRTAGLQAPGDALPAHRARRLAVRRRRRPRRRDPAARPRPGRSWSPRRRRRAPSSRGGSRGWSTLEGQRHPSSLAENVRILLSTDDGQTWKHVLAQDANDGSGVRADPRRHGRAWPGS